MAGLSFAIMDALNVRVGMTFSGGFIDFTLFGILPGLAGVPNNWYFIPIVGILFFAPVYYFFFRWYITKYDLATPGRGAAIKMMSKKEYKDSKEGNIAKELSIDPINYEIIEALGGADNIVDVDACITRLRVSVKDHTQVKDNEYWTSELGAMGLVKNGNAIQAIYGQKAASYKTDINNLLKEYKESNE